jgi:hypothetical protein
MPVLLFHPPARLPALQGVALISIQAVLAIIGLRLFAGGVLPRLHRLRHPQLAIDIWGPLAIIAPMLFMADHVRGELSGAAWIAVGGPMLCAALALGISGLASHGPEPLRMDAGSAISGGGGRGMIIWMVAGVIYLLIAVAHNLTVWTGQAMFALGAVLLWLNTPDGHPHEPARQDDELRAGAAMTLALCCAIGQGAAAHFAGPDWAAISGALMIGHAAIILAAAARIAGADIALRLGGWAATYGLAFGLGLASLLFMMPTVIGAIVGAEVTPTARIAFGFGNYAFESMGLLLLGPAALLMARLPVAMRRLVGSLALLVAAALAAGRLAAIAP